MNAYTNKTGSYRFHCVAPIVLIVCFFWWWHIEKSERRKKANFHFRIKQCSFLIFFNVCHSHRLFYVFQNPFLVYPWQTVVNIFRFIFLGFRHKHTLTHTHSQLFVEAIIYFLLNKIALMLKRKVSWDYNTIMHQKVFIFLGYSERAHYKSEWIHA